MVCGLHIKLTPKLKKEAADQYLQFPEDVSWFNKAPGSCSTNESTSFFLPTFEISGMIPKRNQKEETEEEKEERCRFPF